MSVSPNYGPKLPDAYLREEHSYFVEAGFEAVVYAVQMFTIWGDMPVMWFTVPIFMYGISVALSTLLLLRLPHPTLLPALATPLGIPLPLFYFGLNVCFTCLVSRLITFHLLCHRRALAGSVGAYYYAACDITGQRCTTDAAAPRPRQARAQAERATLVLVILTDSALPYALVGIVQVVRMGTDAAVATGVEGLYGAMAALSLHMIAYRLATGQAFMPDMLAMLQSQPHHSHSSNAYSRLDATDKSLDADADDADVDVVFDAEMGDATGEQTDNEMGDGDAEMAAFLREEDGGEAMMLPALGRG
ncbi:hypothetical protein JB92DRAFT_3134013 [Gautieria morchelliformis]|nr:hypothetical protein JB92DRAFT_3134013 [Gautieria morchelliformis]